MELCTIVNDVMESLLNRSGCQHVAETIIVVTNGIQFIQLMLKKVSHIFKMNF